MRAAVFLSILLLTGIGVFAQTRAENFEITLPEQKVANSLYNTIRYID
jgi:hypothetical protein